MTETHADQVKPPAGTALKLRRYCTLQLRVLPVNPAYLLAAALLIIVLLVPALAMTSSRHATVNGHSVSLLMGRTVADLSRRQKIALQPGDLIDVSGRVLQAGAGSPAVFRVNGATVPAYHRVRPGDVVSVTAAGDRTEPLVQSANFITPFALSRHGPVPLPWQTDTGVGGIRYVQRGQISGKLHSVQMASLTPAHGTGMPGTRRIALTFDDGPDPTYTPQILDILDRHNARATFFILGVWAAKHPDIVRRAVAEGHEIGCHSWSHPHLTRLSSDTIRQQIRRWEQTVNPLLPDRARYFRPPYGAVDSRVRSVATDMGYTVVLWTADPTDWRRPGADVIYRRVMAAAHDGANVLMHDGGGNRAQTVAALRRLVPDLQARGYQLVTLSELHDRTDPWNGQFIIHTDIGRLHLKPADPRMAVVINGTQVEMPVRPVEIDGQLLLPARPTLELAGSQVYYDKPTGRLHINAPLYSLQMDMNRRTLQVGSEQLWMAVPPVLYRGHSMIPLWLIRQYCGVSATWNPDNHTLYLWSDYGRDRSAQALLQRPTTRPRLSFAVDGLAGPGL